MARPLFILASASPRRLQLLQQVELKPDRIIPANIDETPHKGESPVAYTRRVARQKAVTVAATHADAVVLAADTIVVAGRRIFPKTDDEKIARATLQFLSGRRHRVYTAVCVVLGSNIQEALEVTLVKFSRLGEKEIDAYIASKQWHGKAGAYAIQGMAENFIPWVNGSFSNVVGLPLAKTCHMLRRVGVT